MENNNYIPHYNIQDSIVHITHIIRYIDSASSQTIEIRNTVVTLSIFCRVRRLRRLRIGDDIIPEDIREHN